MRCDDPQDVVRCCGLMRCEKRCGFEQSVCDTTYVAYTCWGAQTRLNEPSGAALARMSLSALPAVLVQTLMHALKPKELLSFARCSGWTLQCADSAFAWRDCPALALLDFQEDSPVPSPESRLCRWIPLSVRSWHGSLCEARAEHLLLLMRSCPRIVSVGWDEWELSVERGLQLLSHPSLQQVRYIGLCESRSLCAEWIAAAGLLPCLSELDLSSSELEASALLPLIHARALRNLSVSEAEVERLSVVMQLTQLTTLLLYLPRLNGKNFLAFCTAMSGLEELQLYRWSEGDVRSISSADLAAGFAALRSLRAIKFFLMFDEETLAPVLHLVPALRLLLLPTFERNHDFTRLAQLSRAAPMLDIQFYSQHNQESFQSAKRALGPIAQ